MTAPLADRYDLMVREEATYGTLATFNASTDGVIVMERPDLPLDYTSTGQRGAVPGSLGSQRRAKANGRSGSLPLMVEAKGRGAPYSGTDTASDLHALLKACGLVATYSAAPTPNWVFSLDNALTAGTSVSVRLANGPVQYDLRGALGTFTFTGNPGEVAAFEFALQGIANDPVSQTLLGTVTYPGLSVVPPVFESAQLVIGDFTTAVVRSVTCELGRAISPRRNVNAAGAHGGFAHGRAAGVRWRISIEQRSLVGSPFHTSGGLDPFQLISPTGAVAPSSFGVSCRFGSAQYNRGILSSPTCTLLNCTPGVDGSVATWDLEVEPFGTSPLTVTLD